MEFLEQNNLIGLFIGFCMFLVIGLFHVLVVRAEYYLSKKSWILFLVIGIVFAAAALLVRNFPISTLLSVVAFSCFWSIYEVIEQEERVRKGWAKMNPKRKNYYQK
ncbi:MAG: DUF4491 family protein [Prevotellaceae bacterium]|jgi:hypothetical protein|nr:DUF4491 family protein [Prevotellaceae bacterium]